MTEMKKERLISIAAILVPVLLAIGLGMIVQYGGQQKLEAYLENVKGNQENHLEASRVHEADQDGRIEVNTQRSRDNAVEIRMLGPIAREDAITRTIQLVQAAIECEVETCDESCWVHVPGAGANAVPEDVRVRVEEHFRRLGFSVSRERPTPSGEWRGFWIYVIQTKA